MQVTLRLFALAKQTLGQSELPLQLPDSATVADLRQELARTCPALASLLPSLMIAINSEYVDDQTPIAPGQEIALIPPVSGGGASQANGSLTPTSPSPERSKEVPRRNREQTVDFDPDLGIIALVACATTGDNDTAG